MSAWNTRLRSRVLTCREQSDGTPPAPLWLVGIDRTQSGDCYITREMICKYCVDVWLISWSRLQYQHIFILCPHYWGKWTFSWLGMIFLFVQLWRTPPIERHSLPSWVLWNKTIKYPEQWLQQLKWLETVGRFLFWLLVFVPIVKIRLSPHTMLVQIILADTMISPVTWQAKLEASVSVTCYVLLDIKSICFPWQLDGGFWSVIM